MPGFCEEGDATPGSIKARDSILFPSERLSTVRSRTTLELVG
jgi:hypothetical protein